MKQKLLWLLPLLCLSACAGQHHPLPDSTSAYGDPPLPDSEGTRQPSQVHTYVVNDYIDPNNPRILHRGHVVDVVEQDEKWNLNSTDEAQPPSGPVNTVSDPNAAPNPYSAEFETELTQQRQQYQQLAGIGAQMTAEMEKLQEMAQKNADAVSENASLRNRLNELQQEVDELKPPPSPPVASDAPKKPSWWNVIWDLFRQMPQGKPVVADKADLRTSAILRPLEMRPPSSELTNAPTAPSTNATGDGTPDAPVPSPGEMAQPESQPVSQP